jgi:hypothetical protein
MAGVLRELHQWPNSNGTINSLGAKTMETTAMAVLPGLSQQDMLIFVLFPSLTNPP